MKKVVILFSVLMLNACASVIDTQLVQMTIRTPGTDNAKCYIENQDHKYVAYTDQTIEVKKTPYDYQVRCIAPGNRSKTVIVKREVNQWVLVNAVNGFIPGTAYDVLSRGAFDYANEVIVSFEGIERDCNTLAPYEHGDHCVLPAAKQKQEFTLNKKQRAFANPVYNDQDIVYDEKVAPPVLTGRKAREVLP